MEALVIVAAIVLVVVIAVGVGGRKRNKGPETELVKLTFGDVAQAERLLKEELRRTPALSRPEAAARAARRLKRDRAR